MKMVMNKEELHPEKQTLQIKVNIVPHVENHLYLPLKKNHIKYSKLRKILNFEQNLSHYVRDTRLFLSNLIDYQCSFWNLFGDHKIINNKLLFVALTGKLFKY